MHASVKSLDSSKRATFTLPGARASLKAGNTCARGTGGGPRVTEGEKAVSTDASKLLSVHSAHFLNTLCSLIISN